MKNLKELKGVKLLSKAEQKVITGGLACRPDGGCPTGTHCCYGGLFDGLCRKTC
ncbi:MAG: hypothetical protein HXX16_09225 [Bacteroidales bacterium]|nr:hypothetical protein [Bacteroidales bacterium]